MGAILLAIDPSGTNWFTVALCVVLAALAFFVIVKLKGETLQHFNVVVAVVVATLIVAGTVALVTVTGASTS